MLQTTAVGKRLHNYRIYYTSNEIPTSFWFGEFFSSSHNLPIFIRKPSSDVHSNFSATTRSRSVAWARKKCRPANNTKRRNLKKFHRYVNLAVFHVLHESELCDVGKTLLGSSGLCVWEILFLWWKWMRNEGEIRRRGKIIWNHTKAVRICSEHTMTLHLRRTP